ncbi:MAG: M48 family metallopeptidase [Terracidiphilus sp.]
MTTRVSRLPSRKWSIAALGSAGMALVIVSYLLAIFLGFACLALPVVLLGYLPIGGPANFLVYRMLFSVFGIATGLTIFWSLVPPNDQHQVNGVRIDLNQEMSLAKEIKAIATELREPMPTEVYLIGDANAFVREEDEAKGFGRRRILALGLPLLQMLTISQFRAVLAHEFAHYYAGDTRLGPWVYEARVSLSRLYQNLGKHSQVMPYLRRWWIMAIAYKFLMNGLKMYWMIFMRITQAISRRQEIRSDELACYIAGSQALIDGFEGIAKCSAGLNAYWNSFVLPVAMGGYQPDLTNGFQQFMHVPHVVKATSEYLAHQASVTKQSPFDSHPPLNLRIDQARRLNLPAPQISAIEDAELPMISLLIEDVKSLEASLLTKILPTHDVADLKPLNWETAGTDIYIPEWRKSVANYIPFLSTKKLGDLPFLVLDPQSITALVPHPYTGSLHRSQRLAIAYEILLSAFALCLLANGWNLVTRPGYLALENGPFTVDPPQVIGDLKSGTLSVVAWRSFRAERSIGDWPLFDPIAALPPS